jgi:hypothetical protein
MAQASRFNVMELVDPASRAEMETLLPQDAHGKRLAAGRVRHLLLQNRLISSAS